jgi:pimeloyl-ACP methyl ester carboxylesterase
MKLPIVYVRGFAGSTSSINEAVDDPFYGFNLGATHVRVGGDGEPHFYQFESPMLRLLIDRDEDGEAYQIFVHGGQEAHLNSRGAGQVDKNSIWIHRFYDESASTFGKDPRRYRIENAAADLLRFVDLVLLKTGADKVHLIAHSMGGLIAAR